MPIRCVLFDFDGVIADTEERNADYLASALAHFGVRLTDADRSALVGINDPSLLEALLKRAETPVTLEQLQAERTRHGNYYETVPICTRSPVCGSFSLRFAHRAFAPA